MVMESIIQVYLWCQITRQLGWGEEILQGNRHAKIPRVYQLVRSLSDRSSKTALQPTNMIVMEPLRGTLEDLIRWSSIDFDTKRNIVNEAFKQLALTLSVLQKHCSFEHRDLHIGNVMYTANARPIRAGNLQFYIIDFGMSIMRIDNKWLYDKRNTAPDGENTSGTMDFVNETLRRGGDLAQVALDIRQTLRDKGKWDTRWRDEWWAKNLDHVDTEKQDFIDNSDENTHTYSAYLTSRDEPDHWIAYSDRFHYKSFKKFSPASVLKNFHIHATQRRFVSVNRTSHK
jgi:hypothetical protein